MSRFLMVGRLARFVGVSAVALVALVAAPARADVIYNLSVTFNGTAPTSTPPWLTATFHDVSAGTVDLTLTSHLNVASEFIDQVAFNVIPSITPSALTIVQNPVANPIPTSIANTTDDAQDITGGGNPGKGFDVLISWTTSSGVGRFDDSDSVTFRITGPSGLTAAAFDTTNPSGLFIAAHIQGIPVAGGGTTSGAVTAAVPEPSSLALIGCGLGVGLGAAVRRRLRRPAC